MDVKICDFGLARGLDTKIDTTMSTLYVVTRWYRSPELCMDYIDSNLPLDIWSAVNKFNFLKLLGLYFC
jgi:serine/threonine protein kinase